jgi:hypothetical protein
VPTCSPTVYQLALCFLHNVAITQSNSKPNCLRRSNVLFLLLQPTNGIRWYSKAVLLFYAPFYTCSDNIQMLMRSVILLLYLTIVHLFNQMMPLLSKNNAIPSVSIAISSGSTPPLLVRQSCTFTVLDNVVLSSYQWKVNGTMLV